MFLKLDAGQKKFHWCFSNVVVGVGGGEEKWKVKEPLIDTVKVSSLPRSPIHQDLSPSIDEARSQKPCDENPPYNDTPP